MSKSGRMEQVKKVYSHPQALAQCRLWLEASLPGVKIIESANTAKAAQITAQDPSAAAIAPEMAARIYRLRAIARRIEDMQDNFTRFLVIGKTFAEKTGDDKTSLMVSIKDKVGALYDLLLPFRKNGLNMTSIESRPSRKKACDYYFSSIFWPYPEFTVQAAVATVEKANLTVKVLGSYPRSES